MLDFIKFKQVTITLQLWVFPWDTQINRCLFRLFIDIARTLRTPDSIYKMMILNHLSTFYSWQSIASSKKLH